MPTLATWVGQSSLVWAQTATDPKAVLAVADANLELTMIDQSIPRSVVVLLVSFHLVGQADHHPVEDSMDQL